MDGNPYIENDYRIREILRKNKVTDINVFEKIQDATCKDVLNVGLSIWRKSLDHHFPFRRVDAVIFAHNKNHSTAIEIQNHLKKILCQLEPKIEIFSKELWTPVDDGSLRFKTSYEKEVSASSGFLVVTPEFCSEEWGILAEQPFFQRAMYDKDVTIVPVFVENPRKMKEKIPLGIKCLRSIDFYNKDDIISQKAVETLLKPLIRARVKKERGGLKNHIYWLYSNVIAKLPDVEDYNHPWSSPKQSRHRMPSQDDSDYFSRSTSQSYNQQSLSLNGKYSQSTGQGFTRDSAYGSGERTSQWSEPKGSVSPGNGICHHPNQSADDTDDIPHAPSLNLRSLSESVPPMKSHKNKVHSPLQRDIGEQRSTNRTTSCQDETDIKMPFSHATKPTSTSPRSNSDYDDKNSVKPNDLLNAKPSASEHCLPVAVEVECNNLFTLSSHSFNVKMPSTDSQGTSDVPNIDPSSSSSSKDQRRISNRRETTQMAFKQFPSPQPINVSNTLWNSHSISSSRHSSHRQGLLTEPGDIPRSAFYHNHPKPQPLQVQIDKLPSVDLTSHNISTSEPPSNVSAMSRRPESSSCHPPPRPQEIFINSFPPDVEQTNTSNPASFKTAHASLPDRDVTQLPFGCFRPSGDYVSAPSSGYWDAQREKMVNVVKPISFHNNHDDDDDDEDVINNDLSIPDTHLEETTVKQILP